MNVNYVQLVHSALDSELLRPFCASRPQAYLEETDPPTVIWAAKLLRPQIGEHESGAVTASSR